jgi:hypothetical protein
VTYSVIYYKINNKNTTGLKLANELAQLVFRKMISLWVAYSTKAPVSAIRKGVAKTTP